MSGHFEESGILGSVSFKRLKPSRLGNRPRVRCPCSAGAYVRRKMPTRLENDLDLGIPVGYKLEIIVKPVDAEGVPVGDWGGSAALVPGSQRLAAPDFDQ